MRIRLVIAALLVVVVGVLLTPGGALASSGGGRLAIAPVSGKGLVVAAANGRGARRVCVAARFCGRVEDPQWAADGREFVFSTRLLCAGRRCVPKVVVGTPDGTCVNCTAMPGSASSLQPLGSGTDPTLHGGRGLINTVRGGSLRRTTLLGQSRGVLARGVSAGVVSARGALTVVRRGAIWVGSRGHLRRLGLGGQPAWSPRGFKVAFVRDGVIMLTRPGGRGLHRVVRGRSPAWSPDGRQLAYIGEKDRVMEVTLAGDRVRRVGDLRGWTVAWGPAPRRARCVAPIGTHPLVAPAGTTLEQASLPNRGRTLVGCFAAQGVPRVLLSLGISNQDGTYSLAQAVADGPYAGVVISFVDQHYGGDFQAVTVYDLRTGRPAPHLGGETAVLDPAQNIVGGTLDDLVINRAGETAVHAVQTYAPSNPTGSTIYHVESILASTRAGVQTITTAPANASDTTLANLTLNASTLSYTENGTPHTTALR